MYDNVRRRNGEELMKLFLIVIALLFAGCSAPVDGETTDVSQDELTAQAWSISSYDALTSYASAQKAAATLITAPAAVQLHGELTPGSDNMHTVPQPSKPVYQWTWTFRGKNGDIASVLIGRGKKPKASLLKYDPTSGAAVLNFSSLNYRARDLYKEIVKAYPEETHHAFDALDLVGPMAGNPQGWQVLVYEQGNDDRLFFVGGAAGGASEMSID